MKTNKLRLSSRFILVLIALTLATLTFAQTPVPQAQLDAYKAEYGQAIYNLCFGTAVSLISYKPTGSPVVSVVSGSGVVIDPSGYAITNAHVVHAEGVHGAIFMDGGKYQWHILGFLDSTDIAVIKIDADKPLPFAKIGKSANLKMGDKVIVCGYPGQLQFTISKGTATAITGWGYEWGEGGSFRMDYIQTNASIAPGNSGGPMFNSAGELVGIACGSQGGTPNGYAIPIDAAMKILPELLDKQAAKGYILGLKVAAIGRPSVVEVASDSPAFTAKVKVGDVVNSIDGKSVNIGFDYYGALADKKAGDTVKLELTREGKPINASITLKAVEMRPAETLKKYAQGINLKYYKNSELNKLPDFNTLKPTSEGSYTGIDLNAFGSSNGFALQFTGYVFAPTDGVYKFYLVSDDGSKLFIGDKLLVDNDGLHGAVSQQGYISLKAGLHPIRVEYFDRGGGKKLMLYYQGPGSEMKLIPSNALFTKIE
jgi:S1-C subfamily serine protease